MEPQPQPQTETKTEGEKELRRVLLAGRATYQYCEVHQTPQPVLEELRYNE